MAKYQPRVLVRSVQFDECYKGLLVQEERSNEPSLISWTNVQYVKLKKDDLFMLKQTDGRKVLYQFTANRTGARDLFKLAKGNWKALLDITSPLIGSKRFAPKKELVNLNASREIQKPNKV